MPVPLLVIVAALCAATGRARALPLPPLTAGLGPDPSGELSDSEVELYASVMKDPAFSGGGYIPLGNAPKRITAKSVFIAPSINGDQSCADGYQQDEMGRCVKVVKVDPEKSWDIFLDKLNSQFGGSSGESASESTSPPGPLQVAIPIADVAVPPRPAGLTESALELETTTEAITEHTTVVTERDTSEQSGENYDTEEPEPIPEVVMSSDEQQSIQAMSQDFGANLVKAPVLENSSPEPLLIVAAPVKTSDSDSNSETNPIINTVNSSPLVTGEYSVPVSFSSTLQSKVLTSSSLRPSTVNNNFPLVTGEYNNIPASLSSTSSSLRPVETTTLPYNLPPSPPSTILYEESSTESAPADTFSTTTIRSTTYRRGGGVSSSTSPSFWDDSTESSVVSSSSSFSSSSDSYSSTSISATSTEAKTGSRIKSSSSGSEAGSVASHRIVPSPTTPSHVRFPNEKPTLFRTPPNEKPTVFRTPIGTIQFPSIDVTFPLGNNRAGSGALPPAVFPKKDGFTTFFTVGKPIAFPKDENQGTWWHSSSNWSLEQTRRRPSPPVYQYWPSPPSERSRPPVGSASGLPVSGAFRISLSPGGSSNRSSWHRRGRQESTNW